MTLIPTGMLDRWRTRARRGALMKLKSLLEFRDLVDDAKAEGILMQVYAEASEAMMLSVDTLRRDIGIIRAYPKDRLTYWIENGVSFDHIEKSNAIQEYAHKDAAKLLDEAIELGDENGKTMTVNQLVSHALGEQTVPSMVFRANRLFDGFVKFSHSLHWESDKKQRFNDWIEQGKEFFK